jgi:precorrin-2 dehydrogenase/sirohydrochlorin ferrochelatase
MPKSKERELAMPLFPMFLKLQGRRCLVVGAGRIGQPKIESLLQAGAKVVVVAPRATSRVRELAGSKQIVWRKRNYSASDLSGIFLVIAATDSPRVHEKIYRLAQSRGVLCNSVDDPAHCDFFYPAVVRRGPLQIAISTSGASPALAQRLRRQLGKQFGVEYAAWVEGLGQARRTLFANPMSAKSRRRLLHRMARIGPPRVSAPSRISTASRREA